MSKGLKSFLIIFSSVFGSIIFILGVLSVTCVNNGKTFSLENKVKIKAIPQTENIASEPRKKELNDIIIDVKYGEYVEKFIGDDFYVSSKSAFKNSKTIDKINLIRFYGQDKVAQKKEDIKLKSTDKIERIKSNVQVVPKNAEVNFNPTLKNSFEIVAEQTGVLVKEYELIKEIEYSANNNLRSVSVPVEIVYPTLTREEIVAATSQRASFSTYYGKSNSRRRENVELALKALDGLIVAPDQIVSFNSIVGNRTEENGYKEAKIIVGGKYVPGVGGGVCQVSTTLYNALLLANLEIVEQHPHSLPSSYVKPSFDAMVSSNFADLKFKNSSGNYLFFKAYGKEGKAIIEIYGEKLNSGISISRVSKVVEFVAPPADEIIYDNGEYANLDLYDGDKYYLKKPENGVKSEAYLVYKKNDVEIFKRKLREDIYSPEQGVLIIGTKTFE